MVLSLALVKSRPIDFYFQKHIRNILTDNIGKYCVKISSNSDIIAGEKAS